MGLNILLLFFSMIISWVPYGGPFMAFILSIFFTVRTYTFIKSVQKEDKEEALKLILQAKGIRGNPTKQMLRDYTRYTKAEKTV
jgi:hypothetical protein